MHKCTVPLIMANMVRTRGVHFPVEKEVPCEWRLFPLRIGYGNVLNSSETQFPDTFLEWIGDPAVPCL